MSKMKRMLCSRAALALVAWVAYALAFIPLHRLVGLTVAALAILPVVATGQLFGMRAGLLAGLLVFSLNMLLMTLGGAGWDVMIREGLLGSIVIVLIGAVVGRLHDMGEQVKQELIKRRQAEEALYRAHDELEMQVQERTADLAQANEALRAEVTERKRTEEALARERNLLRTIIDNLPDLIYVKDIESRYSISNAAHIRFLGATTPGEVVGKSVFELFPQELAKQYYADDQKVIQSGQPLLEREERSVDPTGNDVWNLTTKVPLRDSYGKIVGIVGVARDITEHKQTEEALRESEKKYRAILENIEEGYYEVDIAGNFTFFNDSLCRLHGYPENELMGMNNRQYMDAETAKRVYQIFNTVYRTGESAEISDWGVIRKDGTRRFVEASVSLVRDPTGEPAGFRGIVRDITERKQAEEELIRLSNAVRMSTDSIVISDLEGKIIEVNEATLKMYSTDDKGDLVGKNSFDLIAPEEREKAFAGMGEILEKGYIKGWEYHVITKDGSRIPVEMSVSILKDADSKPIGFVGIIRDITERKRVEEALRDEKALMDALMDNIPDSIYFKDRQCRLIRINRKMMRDLNLDEMSQAVGKTDVDLFGEEFGRKTLAEDQRIMATGEPIIGLIESRQLEGGQINWTLTTKVPLRDASGQIVGLVGITHEINEFMRAEEELRQLKEFNEGIVQGMEEGIMMEDAEGYITFVNPKMAEMLGYTEKELRGKHWSETVAPSCLRQVEEQSSKRPKGISTRYEVLLLHKDGKEVPSLVSARPLFRDGEFAGTLATCTDLTERKEMEQQLIQAGKLAAMGQLVAGVAHELNNPLTSVVGYSQLLMEAQCSEEMKRDLERINRQAVRAARIVENLLTFARRREPRKESININDVIERGLELQAHQLEMDHISIVKELDEALPPIMADSFQMQQVFMNIIGNALQALRDWKGERRLRVRSEPAGDMIHLEFADSGPGIPAEVMGRLFEPFFTTREVGEGTGLGLSISYGIVEAHGGKIWAESKVGRGATFIVEIPVKGN